MITLSCLCGDIRIEVCNRPEFINECNCAFCAKSGARWGYFHPSEVGVEGETKGFRRTDKDDPAAELHFCPTCGCTTHFRLTAATIAKLGDSMMGVNMGLADQAELAGVELRYPDGKSWQGEGEFGFVREAHIIGA